MNPRPTERTDPARRPPRTPVRLEHVLAMLAGVGLGLAAFGFAEQWYRILDPTPITVRLVWGAVLLGVAVGPSLPPALALWVALRAFRRGTARAALAARLAVGGEVDLSLLWTVLASLALVAGLALLGSPLLLSVVQAAYETLLRRFVWGPTTLTALEAVLIAATAVPVFALLGWVVSCMPIVTRSADRWDVRVVPWALRGVALSVLVPVATGLTMVPPPVWIVAGAVPFLVVAILAIHRPQVPRGWDEAVGSGDFAAPPDARDGWLAGLRVVMAMAALALVVALFGWCRVLGILGRLEQAGSLGLWALGMAAVAGGMSWSCRHDWTRIESVGALGTVCVASGVAMAATLVVAALASPSVGRGHGGGLWFWLLGVLCVGAPAVAGGYATASAAGTVLARLGSRPTIGSALLSLVSLSLSAFVYLFLWPVLAALGTYAFLAAGALMMLAVGGVLMINEPAAARRPRMLRVATVFGTVIVMTLALPRPAKRWLMTRSGERTRLLETQWLTVSRGSGGEDAVRAEPPSRRRVSEGRYARSPAAGPLLLLDAVPPDKRVLGLFGASPRLMREAGLHLPPERLYPFDPSALDLARAGRVADGDRNRLSGTRVLRLKRDWDILVVDLNTLSGLVRRRLLDTGILTRVRNALSPDGIALVLVPLGTISPEELDHWTRSAMIVSGNRLSWTCLGAPGEPVLVLVFGRDGQWRDRWARWSRHPLRPASELP